MKNTQLRLALFVLCVVRPVRLQRPAAELCSRGRQVYGQFDDAEASRLFEACWQSAPHDASAALAYARVLQQLALAKSREGGNATSHNEAKRAKIRAFSVLKNVSMLWPPSLLSTTRAMKLELELDLEDAKLSSATVAQPPRWAWRHGDQTYFRAFLSPELQALARAVPQTSSEPWRHYSASATQQALHVPLNADRVHRATGSPMLVPPSAIKQAVQRLREHGVVVIGGGWREAEKNNSNGTGKDITRTLLAPALLRALRTELLGSIAAQQHHAPLRAPLQREHRLLTLEEANWSAGGAAGALQQLAEALSPLFAELSGASAGVGVANATTMFAGYGAGEAGANGLVDPYADASTPLAGASGAHRNEHKRRDQRECGNWCIPRWSLAELALINVLPGAASQTRHADVMPSVRCDYGATSRSAANSYESCTGDSCACGRRTFSVFVPLHDVNFDGGALQVWPGSHVNALNVDTAPSLHDNHRNTDSGEGRQTGDVATRMKAHNPSCAQGSNGDGVAHDDGEERSMIDHYDALGVRLALTAGSVVVYNSRLVHRGRAHCGDTERPMLMFTLTEDGAERQSDGRHFPHWGSNSNDTQPPPASGSSYSLLPRYGSAGAWRFSLADLASGRAAFLDAQLQHDVLSGSVVILDLDGRFQSASAHKRALEATPHANCLGVYERVRGQLVNNRPVYRQLIYSAGGTAERKLLYHKTSASRGPLWCIGSQSKTQRGGAWWFVASDAPTADLIGSSSNNSGSSRDRIWHAFDGSGGWLPVQGARLLQGAAALAKLSVQNRNQLTIISSAAAS
eukprot:g2419.t1